MQASATGRRARQEDRMRHGIPELALALLVALPAGAAWAAGGEGCAVSRQVGTAALLRGAAAMAVTPAMAVEPGDHVTTGPRARVEIRCNDASARSTIWIVEVTPDDTAAFVARGIVDVGSREVAGSVVLDAGYGTDVRRGAPPTPPKRWGQARVDGVMARTALP
jgi:hypothetical protein